MITNATKISVVKYEVFDAEVIALTDRAALLEISGCESWVPLSVIYEDDANDLSVGYSTEVRIAKWFATKEGLL